MVLDCLVAARAGWSGDFPFGRGHKFKPDNAGAVSWSLWPRSRSLFFHLDARREIRTDELPEAFLVAEVWLEGVGVHVRGRLALSRGISRNYLDTTGCR
jgi:hypothetical protein